MRSGPCQSNDQLVSDSLTLTYSLSTRPLLKRMICFQLKPHLMPMIQRQEGKHYVTCTLLGTPSTCYSHVLSFPALQAERHAVSLGKTSSPPSTRSKTPMSFTNVPPTGDTSCLRMCV